MSDCERTSRCCFRKNFEWLRNQHARLRELSLSLLFCYRASFLSLCISACIAVCSFWQAVFCAACRPSRSRTELMCNLVRMVCPRSRLNLYKTHHSSHCTRCVCYVRRCIHCWQSTRQIISRDLGSRYMANNFGVQPFQCVGCGQRATTLVDNFSVISDEDEPDITSHWIPVCARQRCGLQAERQG